MKPAALKNGWCASTPSSMIPIFIPWPAVASVRAPELVGADHLVDAAAVSGVERVVGAGSARPSAIPAMWVELRHVALSARRPRSRRRRSGSARRTAPLGIAARRRCGRPAPALLRAPARRPGGAPTRASARTTAKRRRLQRHDHLGRRARLLRSRPSPGEQDRRLRPHAQRRSENRFRVRMRGLEPPRPKGHTDLNRARLPIPPHPRARSVASGVCGSPRLRSARSLRSTGEHQALQELLESAFPDADRAVGDRPRRRRPLRGARHGASLAGCPLRRPAPAGLRRAGGAARRRHDPRTANQDEGRRRMSYSEKIKDVIDGLGRRALHEGHAGVRSCAATRTARSSALRRAGAPVTAVDILPDTADPRRTSRRSPAGRRSRRCS